MEPQPPWLMSDTSSPPPPQWNVVFSCWLQIFKKESLPVSGGHYIPIRWKSELSNSILWFLVFVCHSAIWKESLSVLEDEGWKWSLWENSTCKLVAIAASFYGCCRKMLTWDPEQPRWICFASCSDAAAWLYNYACFRELFMLNVAENQITSVVSVSSFVISALHRGFAGFSISLSIFDPAGVDLLLYGFNFIHYFHHGNSSECHLAFLHFELLVEQLPLIMYTATSWTILIFTWHILIWC